MYALFLKGGPVMWPLLAISVVALATALERILFLLQQMQNAQPELVKEILLHVEAGEVVEAVRKGSQSQDPIVKTLVYGLLHRDRSLSGALIRAASAEMESLDGGIATLDTVVTLAPLLGLLGTVTGMVRAFGLLGARELEAPVAITGGVAEALIATAFGLMIAILSLIPLNILNSYCAKTRRRIEQAATELEYLLAAVPQKRVSHANPIRIPATSTAD